MTKTKKLYLAAYDYGTGGAWFAFRAQSADEIRSAYPELEVVSARPEWMDDDTFERIKKAGIWDIDEPPSGLLLQVIQTR